MLLCRRGPGFQPGIYLWRRVREEYSRPGFSSPLPIVIRDLLFPEDRRVTESGSFSCSPSREFPIQAGLLCINFRADATRYHIGVVIEIECIYIYRIYASTRVRIDIRGIDISFCSNDFVFSEKIVLKRWKKTFG